MSLSLWYTWPIMSEIHSLIFQKKKIRPKNTNNVNIIQFILVNYTHELWCTVHVPFNTLRPRQNGRHFPDDILKWIFLNENVWITIEISLKIVPKGQINNILALVQIMAWRRPGDKPLSESMMVSLLTHIHVCVTRPQWVNYEENANEKVVCKLWNMLFRP